MFNIDRLSRGEDGERASCCGRFRRVFDLNSSESRPGTVRVRDVESVGRHSGQRALGIIEDFQSLVASICDSSDDFETLNSINRFWAYKKI